MLFLVSHFNIFCVPCGKLSWLPVSFLLHVKYTLSYLIRRILSVMLTVVVGLRYVITLSIVPWFFWYRYGASLLCEAIRRGIGVMMPTPVFVLRWRKNWPFGERSMLINWSMLIDQLINADQRPNYQQLESSIDTHVHAIRLCAWVPTDSESRNTRLLIVHSTGY